MPVYNVILSTSITTAEPFGNLVKPIDKTDLANVTWLVNWDGLFGQDVLRYKKCVLRYALISNSSASITTLANTGYLVATGLSTDKQAGNYPGTFLGLVTIQTAPGGNSRFYTDNLGDFHGVQINVPTGVGQLGFRFYNYDAQSTQGNIPNYVLQLQFHLFNDEV